MSVSRKNIFKRAVRHLNSTQIDEKLSLLNEVPTNSTATLYTVEPEFTVQDPDVPGVEREADFEQDDPSLNGRDTSGLFLDDGTILTIEPDVGDTSYILGPMSEMWYAWGNFTQIGYIRQSDRKMVNLARITGRLDNWDGSSNFTSYGQLTIEQAVWFRDTTRVSYRAFYPGPPSSTPDEYGRYICTTTGTKKPVGFSPDPRRVPPENGPWDPDDPIPPWIDDKPTPPDIYGDLLLLGLSAALAKGLIAAFGSAGAWAVANSARRLDQFLKWWNRGRNQSVPDENNAPWRDLFANDWAQRGRSADPNLNPNAGWDPIWSFTKGLGTGPTPLGRQVIERPARTIFNLFNSSEMHGDLILEQKQELPPQLLDILDEVLMNIKTFGEFKKFVEILNRMAKHSNKTTKESNSFKNKSLLESRQKILRDIKKPYVLPEEPKLKFKHRPKVRSVGSGMMKEINVEQPFKRENPNIWRKTEVKQNARLSQERKNQVLEYVGESDHAWEWLTETNKDKNKKIMYTHFDGDKKKTKKDYNIVRKEQLNGDYLVFLIDETGKQVSMLQSELNEKIASEMDKEVFGEIVLEQEITDEPLFKKVGKKIKKATDYANKPSKNGYPNNPPPKTVNGYHPEYGVRDNMYNRVDSVSSETMKKVDKIKNLIGKKSK